MASSATTDPRAAAPYADLPSEQITMLRQGIRKALAAGYPLQAIDQDVRKKYGYGVQQIMAATGNDFGRSIAQGLTLDHADELTGLWAKLTGGDYTKARDQVRANEAAFVEGHPALNFVTKLTAGALPTLAAAPFTGGSSLAALAGRGALTGAVMGGIAGEGASTATTAAGVAKDAATSAALSSVLGAGGGALTAKLGGITGNARAVSEEAASQLPADPAALHAALLRQEQLAPGTVVMADLSPGMRRIAQAVGADRNTAMVARDAALDRVKALREAVRGVGSGYDQLAEMTAPVDATLKDALKAAGRANAVKGATVTLDQVADLRSTLLAEARATRNTAVAADKRAAANALTDWLTDQAPWIKQVDSDYAFLSDRLKAARDTYKAVASSSANYAANRAAGVESGSVGGSIPVSTHGAVGTVVNYLTKPDRPARAKAIADLLLTPQRDATGLRQLVSLHDMLLSPTATTGQSLANALFGGAVAPTAASSVAQ